MRRFIILFICIVFTIPLMAVQFKKNGVPEGKNYYFNLSAEQVSEVSKTRYLTLSNAQYKVFKNSKIPRKIPVITPSYSNCSCQFDIYGVWYSSNKVAVPVEDVRLYLQPEDGVNNSLNYGIKFPIRIIIGINNEFFYNNINVDDDVLLEELKSKIKMGAPSDVNLILNFPPLKNNNDKKKILKKISNSVKFCKKNGIDIVDWMY